MILCPSKMLDHNYALVTPRRIPLPLKSQELKRMEQLGVIRKVDIPTKWCVGMVVVPKGNNKVRICVDLTKLNKCVCRERHILPSVAKPRTAKWCQGIYQIRHQFRLLGNKIIPRILLIDNFYHSYGEILFQSVTIWYNICSRVLPKENVTHPVWFTWCSQHNR